MIITSLEILHKYWGEWKNNTKLNPERKAPNLEVYCYDFFPGMQVFSTQERTVIGFYLNHKMSAKGYQLEVEVDGSFGRELKIQIDWLIDHSVRQSHVKMVDFDIPPNKQFSSRHLDSQIEDAIKLIINLGRDEISRFSRGFSIINDDPDLAAVRRKTSILALEEAITLLKKEEEV